MITVLTSHVFSKRMDKHYELSFLGHQRDTFLLGFLRLLWVHLLLLTALIKFIDSEAQRKQKSVVEDRDSIHHQYGRFKNAEN